MNEPHRIWWVLLFVFLAPLPLGVWMLGCAVYDWYRGPVVQIERPVQVAPVVSQVRLSRGMVLVHAGTFVMGDRRHGSADQRPAHEVALDSFWIDQQPVTNDDFQKFIAATGYTTTAEDRGSSLVFDPTQHRWFEVEGARWDRPDGPRSSLVDRADLPVVHVSWYDAQQYASWSGKRLLTEAEYERAARAGLLDMQYAWGQDTPTADRPMANYWQGRFPVKDKGLDGFKRLAPVASYPANRFGLFDMAGNVWCWCDDWYAREYYLQTPRDNPMGPDAGTERIIRGGSWLSSLGPLNELSVAARGHATPDTTTNHIGFRCASSTKPQATPAGVAIAPTSDQRR